MVVVWGASLGGLDSIRFGGGPILRLWFNSTDRLIESFVVFAGWLFELSSSGSGNGNGRLVLATVLSYLPACLSAWLRVELPAEPRAEVLQIFVRSFVQRFCRGLVELRAELRTRCPFCRALAKLQAST
jgi:hypothetical protein